MNSVFFHARRTGLAAGLLGLWLVLAVTACRSGSSSSAANAARQAALDSLLSEQSYAKLQPGSFLMGDEEDGKGSDEHFELRMRPRHRVELTKPFELGKYEVTQAQWQAVMGYNPSQFKDDNLPVESISWNEAQEFIKRLQPLDDKYLYRLPTEAEWEYACRAGSTGLFSGTEWKEVEPKKERARESESERKRAKEITRDPKAELEAEARRDTPEYYKDLLPQAWFRVNSQRKTHPVGQLKPNAWGLYDMHGNVAELCQDWFDFHYYKQSPVKDPQGPETGIQRINRGGNWQMPASYCRAAMRVYGDVNEKLPMIGMRLARMAKP
jgi:formylglycine-generating enzyme required for sulfatase activity